MGTDSSIKLGDRFISMDWYDHLDYMEIELSMPFLSSCPLHQGPQWCLILSGKQFGNMYEEPQFINM